MGIENIKRKGQALASRAGASTIKVNKYDNPKIALELIAHICSSDKQLELDLEKYFTLMGKFWSEYLDAPFYSEREFCNCSDYSIPDFEKIMDEMIQDIMSESTKIKIAVCGGYSAGKSSFLNKLTGIKDLLPTGIQPVSLVNTFVNFTNSVEKVTVKGKNYKDAWVKLDKEVLSCIQHSSKSKIYIASVLKELLVNVPLTKNYLDGFTFIDTPGYNNSLAKNDENKKSDRETALDAFAASDVIFWCIDIDSGTISEEDIRFLNSEKAKGKPKVIILTKKDKKPKGEVNEIMMDVHEKCIKEFSDCLVDIVAVSNDDNPEICSDSDSMSELLKGLMDKFGHKRELSYYHKKTEELFDYQILLSQEKEEELETQNKEAIDDKNSAYKWLQSYKENNEAHLEVVQNVIFDNYDSILSLLVKNEDYRDIAVEGWRDSLNREVEWNQKSGFFSDVNDLQKAQSSGCKRFNTLYNKINDLPAYEYYTAESRRDIFSEIQQMSDDGIAKVEEYFDEAKDWSNMIKKDIKDEEDWIKFLAKYKILFCEVVDSCFDTIRNAVKSYMVSLREMPNRVSPDIFAAISANNMDGFLYCFSDGVNLAECNSQGYNPITWAVHNGNNDMVKFFLENNANLRLKDKRGYNAFETAVMSHYRDICQMLIEHDHSLVKDSLPVQELARMNKFEEWIIKKV